MPKRDILPIILLAGLLLCMPAFAWDGNSAFTPQTSNNGLDKGTADDWFDKGVELYSQGKYEDAIQAWDEAIKINPLLAGAWKNKGNALKNLGKYDEAIKAYDEAIKLDPKLAEAWNNKGVALKNLGKYDDAIKAYDEAIRLDPKNVEAWYGRGGALHALGNHDDAIKAYDEAIKINPQYANAWQCKGFVLQDIGRIAEAEADFAKAEELGYIIPQSGLVGYKNVEMKISTEVGFAGPKLVKREAGSGTS